MGADGGREKTRFGPIATLQQFRWAAAGTAAGTTAAGATAAAAAAAAPTAAVQPGWHRVVGELSAAGVVHSRQ